MARDPPLGFVALGQGGGETVVADAASLGGSSRIVDIEAKQFQHTHVEARGNAIECFQGWVPDASQDLIIGAPGTPGLMRQEAFHSSGLTQLVEVRVDHDRLVQMTAERRESGCPRA